MHICILWFTNLDIITITFIIRIIISIIIITVFFINHYYCYYHATITTTTTNTISTTTAITFATTTSTAAITNSTTTTLLFCYYYDFYCSTTFTTVNVTFLKVIRLDTKIYSAFPLLINQKNTHFLPDFIFFRFFSLSFFVFLFRSIIHWLSHFRGTKEKGISDTSNQVKSMETVVFEQMNLESEKL